MIGRRSLFTAAGAASAAVSSFFAGRAAEAKEKIKKVVGHGVDLCAYAG